MEFRTVMIVMEIKDCGIFMYFYYESVKIVQRFQDGQVDRWTGGQHFLDS